MSDSEHMVLDDKAKAELYPRRGYRQKGYDYISGGSRKSRYNKTNQIKAGLSKLRFQRVDDQAETSHARRYHFTHERNFTHYRVPYYHQAHHLLPREFWHELTTEQKSVLRQVNYNINNGENIVFLPSSDRGQAIHKLPIHNGSHPKYNKAVLKDAAKMKDRLDKAAKRIKPCEENNPPKSIRDDLMKLQNKYWDIVTESTEDKVDNVAKKKTMPKK